MAPYGQFLMFGDSLTQKIFIQSRGFVFGAALQNAYIRRLDVINRGFSGYNTAQGLKILPDLMPAPSQAKVEFLTVFFGANDSCFPDSPESQYVPLDSFRDNLLRILTHPVVTAHNPRIILITPPPVDEYVHQNLYDKNGNITRQRTAEHTKLYADATRQVGTELGIVVLDLWKAFMREAGWKEGEPLVGSRNTKKSKVLAELMYDGVHFNPRGYKILFREMMKTIRENWPDYSPDQMPLIYPAYHLAPK